MVEVFVVRVEGDGLCQCVGGCLEGLALRITAGALLGIGYALMANYITAQYAAFVYVVAVVWWAVSAALATVMASSMPVVSSLRRWFNPPAG